MSQQTFYRHPKLPTLELRHGRDSDACYALHTHAEYSLGAILDGASCYQYRHQHYYINTGSTMLIAPNIPHACNRESESASLQWHYLMLYIDEKAWHSLSEVFQCYLVPDGKPRQDAVLFRLLKQLHRAWSETPVSLLAIETAWLDCFQRLCVLYDKRFKPSVVADNPQTIQLAVEWLNQHLTEEISLAAWAQAVDLPRHQLLRQFRHCIGISPHQYLLNKRIQLAKQLLKSGSSASDVSYQLGFSDQSHFQRTFKRYTAVTPKHYQIANK